MHIIYIREAKNCKELFDSEKLPEIVIKMVRKIIKIFNIIIVKKIDGNFLFIVPNIKNNNFNKKIKNKLEKYRNFYIVLSYKIKNKIDYNINKELIKKVIDGRIIYKVLINNIVQYILSDNELKMIDLYIMQKKYNEKTNVIINSFKDRVRNIFIITDDLKKYKKEFEFFEEEMLMITFLNNTKKSLKRAKLIINYDYLKEEVVKFNINRNAIIINYGKEKIDNLFGFDGIVINDVEIKFNKELESFFEDNNIYEEFNKLELFESIYINESYEQLLIKNIIQDIKIENLIGNNGKINKKELFVKKKLLTNEKN